MVLPVPELELEDDAGNIYPLEWPDRHVAEVSGLGMPPVQHWSTRAPFQHGRTHWGFAYLPRVTNMVLYLRGCNRSDMYLKRRENSTMLAPDNGPHKLRLTWPNGDTYEVHEGWYNAGYELSSGEQGHTWQIGGLQMIWYDPFWKALTWPLDAGESRDDEGRICVSIDTFVQENELVLPFTGPWVLGVTISTGTLNVTNDGSRATFPVIVMEGPVEDWQLINTANGDVLTWTGYAIAAGEVVTIDVKNRTATNAAGDDLIVYLGGNIGTFTLEPGLNALDFWASGGVVNLTTELSVCWFVEFVGV